VGGGALVGRQQCVSSQRKSVANYQMLFFIGHVNPARTSASNNLAPSSPLHLHVNFVNKQEEKSGLSHERTTIPKSTANSVD
jgi:hypothetical protein